MKQKTITINGNEVPVTFNMGALTTFEQATGKSFFGEKFEHHRERVLLVYAAIFAADNKTEIKTSDILAIDDWHQFNAIFDTVWSLAGEFFELPDMVKKNDKDDTPEKEGNDKKNA